MIKLSDTAVMLIKPDGTQVEFDADELQSGIIRSCLAAGTRDVWIAEDIALSIEYALTMPANRERSFMVSDVNSLVIKILEETGYPEVAEEYRHHHSALGIQVSADYEIISELVARHLGLNGNRLADVADRVIDAAEKLDIETASPLLFIELAKWFKEQEALRQEIDLLHLPEMAAPSPWQLVRHDIMAVLPENAVKMVEDKILNFAGVSQLFPALKIDFRLTRLVKCLNLELPLTEMAVIPHFHEVADAINAIYAAVMRLHCRLGDKQQELPVYLTVSDMSRFVCKQLLSKWPEAEPGCREMIVYLEEMLDFQLFKITLK